MRRRLRRLGALALVIAMLLSMFTQSFAADEPQSGASTLSDASLLADGDTATTLKNLDASADDTGKPRLYVDFLGDNAGHNSQSIGGSGATGSLGDGTTVLHPEDGDYSMATGDGNWSRYTNDAVYDYANDATIFYVGVGIDRVNLLKALEGAAPVENEDGTVTYNDAGGVYSFEAGFYYNPDFVEPYIEDDGDPDTTDDYATTIANINLSDGAHSDGKYVDETDLNNHWDGDNYRVVEAVTGIAPQFDGGYTEDVNADGTLGYDEWKELTQEVIANPSNEDIMSGAYAADGWRMTYVSIEMTAEALEEALNKDDGVTDTGARLEGVYDGTFHPTDENDPIKDNRGTEYLLIIPFTLKKYDTNEDLCFRLIRNATHFTLGSMDGGHVNYAAWERVTTRNSDSNLKLQTTFTGDLNIYTGEKMKGSEYTYQAELILRNGGSLSNTAKVTITDDPSPYPVALTQNGHIMTGLAGGTGISVETVTASGYRIKKIEVYWASDGTPVVTFGENGTTPADPNRFFDFIMPEANVVIEIEFEMTDGARDFYVALDETDRLGTSGLVVGNLATITPVKLASDWASGQKEKLTSTDAKDYPADTKLYPSIKVAEKDDSNNANSITVKVDLHPDYYAVVKVTNVSNNTPVQPTGGSYSTNLSEFRPITDAAGTVTAVEIYVDDGEFKFNMPASDVIVEIEYLPAERYTASLELRHIFYDATGNANVDKVNDLNHAQLSYIGYGNDPENVPADTQRRYGSVYRDEKDSNGDSHTPDVPITGAGNIYPVLVGSAPETNTQNGDSATARTLFEDTDYDHADVTAISARAGREVRVAVETSSAHFVEKVLIVDPTGTNAPITATKDSRYLNIYTFQMPAYECEVHVYYVPRVAPTVSVVYSPGYVDGAKVTTTVWKANAGSNYPASASTVSDDANRDDIYNVLADSTVTVKLDNIPTGYTANVYVNTAAGAGWVTSPTFPYGLVSGDVVTFKMASTDVTVTVELVEDAREQFVAVISVSDIDGNTVGGASGVFTANGLPRYYATVGDPLTGVVYVPEGWYIHGVTVMGASTSYPFTQSGNGWSNGSGSGAYVNIGATMPNENLYIDVVLAKGPPPEDPNFGVTLFAKDEENLGTDSNGDGVGDAGTFDDNFATMYYIDADNNGTLDARDKVAGYSPLPSDRVAYDTAYTTGGTTIFVDINIDTDAADDYYVKSVTTAPAYLGVEVVWVDADTFYFVTPEKSMSVTVEFAKIDLTKPEEFTKNLTIDKTEWSNTTETTSTDNTVTLLDYYYLTSLTTDKLISSLPHTEAVDMRSSVTATVKVAAGWRVASARLVYGGYTHYLSLTGLNTDNSGDTTADYFNLSFIMPTRNAELIIDYRQGAPTAGERMLTLIVDDPYNTGNDTNWAKLTDGTTDRLGPFGYHPVYNNGILSGSTVAVRGEVVTIEWETASGYALELITVNTASSGRIAPQYTYNSTTGKTTATFTMPNDHTTVLVRFTKGSERLYRADLVIYEEGDTYGTANNRASFNPLSDTDPDVYIKGDYVNTLHAGEGVTVYIQAVDGFYIDSVTVTPRSTGVATTVTGVFGKQSASFNMPAADVQVNVKFKAGWPTDQGGDPVAKFDVLLTVIDDDNQDDNRAHKLGSSPYVYGGQTRVWVDELADGKIENIHLHSEDGYRVESVEIYDADGNVVDWWWSGAYSHTVAFYMPPREVEVIVTYKQGDPPTNDVTLHATARGGSAGEATLEIVTQNLGEDADGIVPSGTTPTLTPVASDATTAHSGSPVELDVGGTNATYKNGTITAVQTGELLRITATPTPATDYIVSLIYAVSDDTTLVLYSLEDGGASPITGGGAMTFTMPNANVDVYVVFDKVPAPHQHIANLEVSGPGGSGEAQLMQWKGDIESDLTDTVGLSHTAVLEPAGSDYIILGTMQTARVDITPAEGFVLDRVSVVDRYGNPIDYKWVVDTGYYIDKNGDGYADINDTTALVEPTYAITYVQPDGGSWVKVEFKEREEGRTYTAQVVVNNGGEALNNADISFGTIAWTDYLDNLNPGDRIDIKIECEEGYRFDVTILPQSHNIVPTLTGADNENQQTAFRMPADDVIVYVRFERDTRDRYDATLYLVGGGSSIAYLSSDFVTTAKRVNMNGNATVQALAYDENVYARLDITAGEYITSIEVTTVTGDYVPYLLSNGIISFPMVAEDVNIVVRFDTREPEYNATLYVMATQDLSGNGTATLKEDNNPTNTVTVEGDYPEAHKDLPYTVAADTTMYITATLDTQSANGNYYFIDSVYAEYAAGTPYAGQRIAVSISNPSYNSFGELVDFDNAYFDMQPYNVNVYVVYGMSEVDKPRNEYDVKLQIFGDDGAGKVSLTGGVTSIIDLLSTTGGNTQTTAANVGSQMVMTVTLESGYVIDYISVTPIGTDLGQPVDWVVGDSYIFEMPAKDITIQIHIRKSDVTGYIATLHYIEAAPAAKPSYAKVSFTDANALEHYTNGTYTTDSDPNLARNQLTIPEAQRVDLGAYIENTGYYVLSAYVLRENGEMVPLAYGIDGTVYNSGIVSTTPEAKTTFVMPPSNVDVYVVISDLPISGDWTTVALVATDGLMDGTIQNIESRNAEITEPAVDEFIYEIDHKLGAVNTLPTGDGRYTGEVPSGGNATHKAYIVQVGANKVIELDEGNRSDDPDPSYEFVPDAILTASGAATPTLTRYSAIPRYEYYYTMPAVDTATKMHYVQTDGAPDLRVEIIDDYNPSNATVTNGVDVNAANKSPLNLVSTSSAGAWQIISSVAVGDAVSFTAKPHDGYLVYAVLDDGTNVGRIALTQNADGTYSGSFDMPSGDVTLRVVFTRASATLTLYDYGGGSSATMTAGGDTVTVLNHGDSATIVGVNNGDTTDTTVALAANSRIVSVIGYGETTGSSLLTADTNNVYHFDVDCNTEVVVIVEPANTNNPRYTASVSLVNPKVGDGASISASSSAQSAGNIWTTAYASDTITMNVTVSAGRNAKVTIPSGVTVISAGGAVDNGGGVYTITNESGTSDITATFTFTMPAANVPVVVKYTQPLTLSLAVYDPTLVLHNPSGQQGNTASVSGTGVSLGYTSDGTFVNRVVGGPTVVTSGDTITVTATAASGVEVQSVYYQTSCGSFRLLNTSGTATFTMPAESTTVWVVYGTPPATDDPDAKHIAEIFVDPTSTDGWAAAGNALLGILNVTDPSAGGGDFWTYAAQGDEVRGSYTVANGWRVEVTSSETVVQQSSGPNGTATITQGNANSWISVKFIKNETDWTPDTHTLTFKIIGHDEQAGNNATLTINDTAYTGGDSPKTLAGAAGIADPYGETFAATVAFGAQLELEARWADGYTVKKITIEITDNDGNTIATYTVAGSEYNDLITAWMSMPDANATVCVYYSREYIATLYYAFNGGYGSADMYDTADPSTTVSNHGDEIRDLGGGETIRTEPTADTGSRLVGVVYETATGGARPTTKHSGADIYDFEMPEADADVYVVFEPEDGKSYIAMVALEGESGVTVGGVTNDAVIHNVSRPTAVGTDHWKVAQGGDTIKITVTLAKGYQARVTYAKETPGGDSFYVTLTRTLFRTSGLETSFTMPVDTDAIVMIEFIEGYTAELILKDSSSTASNTASMTALGTLVGAESDAGGNVDYTSTDIASGAINDTERVIFGNAPTGDANKISKIGIGDAVTGDASVVADAKLYQLLYSTQVGGTFNVDTNRLKTIQLTSTPVSMPVAGAGTVEWELDPLTENDPVEDVTITAVVIGANELIAKVQLEGDSDINGNGASIENTATGSWLTGNIWTTAVSGNQINTTVTLASGYTATVIAINDKVYNAKLDELDNDGVIDDADIKTAREAAQLDILLNGMGVGTVASITVYDPDDLDLSTVSVSMPSNIDNTDGTLDDISDITIIVTFNGEPGPRPYDPRNDEVSYETTVSGETTTVTLLEKGWIYGVNHGDYATITVPTLIVDEENGVLDDVYRDSTSGNPKETYFRISVWVADVADFVELKIGDEILFYAASEPLENANYPYNTGNYYTDDTSDTDVYVSNLDNTQGYAYTGARFNIELVDVDEAAQSKAYKALADILDNDGSYSITNPLGTLLEIRAVEGGRISEPTQLVIPPYYALEGTIVSYAPTHTTTFTLYDENDSANSTTLAKPHSVFETSADSGIGKWAQDFALRSSDLAGRTAETVVEHDLPWLLYSSGLITTTATQYSGSATYTLTIEKPSALTYVRTGIKLVINAGIAEGGYRIDGSTPTNVWILGREASAAAAAVSELSEDASSSIVTDSAYGLTSDTSTYPMDSEDNSTTNSGYSTGSDTSTYPMDGEDNSTTNNGYSTGSDTSTYQMDGEDGSAPNDGYTVDGDTTSYPAENDPGGEGDSTGTGESDDIPPPEGEDVSDPGGSDDIPDPGGGSDGESATESATPSTLASDDIPAPAATETVRDVIMLVPGEIYPDGHTNLRDHTLIFNHIVGRVDWTRAEEGQPGWDISTLNPDSVAYLCDLNGDTWIDNKDLSILTTSYYFGVTVEFYGDPSGLSRAPNEAYDIVVDDFLNELELTRDVTAFRIKAPSESIVTPPIITDDSDSEQAAD